MRDKNTGRSAVRDRSSHDESSRVGPRQSRTASEQPRALRRGTPVVASKGTALIVGFLGVICLVLRSQVVTSVATALESVLLDGFVVTPICSGAGIAGMLLPSGCLLHALAPTLIVVSTIWVLFALTWSHYWHVRECQRRPEQPVAAAAQSHASLAKRGDEPAMINYKPSDLDHATPSQPSTKVIPISAGARSRPELPDEVLAARAGERNAWLIQRIAEQRLRNRAPALARAEGDGETGASEDTSPNRWELTPEESERVIEICREVLTRELGEELAEQCLEHLVRPSQNRAAG